MYSRAELEETEKKLGDLRIDVENLQSDLIEPQTDKKLAETVQPDVVLLDQHHTELQKLQREIDRLEAKLPAGSKWKTLKFVSETTNYDWYNYKENYNKGMGCDDDVV